MKLLGPTTFRRLNEAVGVVSLLLGVALLLVLASYHPSDPSWNTATGSAEVRNLFGSAGSHVADLLVQVLGFAAFTLPVFILLLAWRWVGSRPIEAQPAKLAGAVLSILSIASAAAMVPGWRLFESSIPAGGLLGSVTAAWLVSFLNTTGAATVTLICGVISIYILTSFSMFHVPGWLNRGAEIQNAVRSWWGSLRGSLGRGRSGNKTKEQEVQVRARSRARRMAEHLGEAAPEPEQAPAPFDETPPQDYEIPIRTLESTLPASFRESVEGDEALSDASSARPVRSHPPPSTDDPVEFRLPSTDLLNEPPGRSPYDEQELKDLAGAVKGKFEEFNVLGSVVEIHPGPVVTTYEYKPEAGIKYSRITTLTEDLCLGLKAESILIERIPGKPTVGIEVPNSKRELISLRGVLESEEFRQARARLPITLGKDIHGRIKVEALETMPHLLIAGSTGSGKSVMLNSLIMSMLFKLTPEQLRLIVVDPKRVELGIYEGVPHLLTPVVTDPKQATNALRNAVSEMERRLKLLASQGVRNIEQFNRKIRKGMEEPRRLFPEHDDAIPQEELVPLPYILIVIDELADLMMVERANVEASVTRLAQMARAVGMHLVLATQRPSVDVITGLIKANFPARISFRVATRVDSRTILDVMGAEHLLGKGDMLFLPPGSSRLVRVHGAYVTETEIHDVVSFWKEQAEPDYDETYLEPPLDEDVAAGDIDHSDPVYEEAVRVVLELGKASTSTLQRRLQLGYGRAARLLDMMQREGIIGPPNGSKPREVLRTPDWLNEVVSPL